MTGREWTEHPKGETVKDTLPCWGTHPSLRLSWDWNTLVPWLSDRLQLSSQQRDGIRWAGPGRHTHRSSRLEKG